MEFKVPLYTVDYEVNKLEPYERLSDGMRRVIDWQNEHAKDAFDTDCSWTELRRKYVEERRFWNKGGPEAYRTVESSITRSSSYMAVASPWATTTPMTV